MKKKFTTTIDEDVIKQAKIQAIEENTSVAELIERLLKEYLGMAYAVLFYFPKNSFSISAVEALFVSSPTISSNS